MLHKIIKIIKIIKMDEQILKDLMKCENPPSSYQIKEAISDVTRGLKEKNNESSNNSNNSNLSNVKAKNETSDMNINRSNAILEKTELKPTKKKLNKNKTTALNSKEPLTMQQMLSAPKSPIFEVTYIYIYIYIQSLNLYYLYFIYFFKVRLRQADILKVMGNDAHKSGFITDAMQLYERALYHCDFQNTNTSFEFTIDYSNSLYKTCDPLHLNLMRCQIKLGFWRRAITESSKITGLEVRKGYSCPLKVLAKAHFLCGKSQMKLRDFHDAIFSLNKSIEYLKLGNDGNGAGIDIGVDEDIEIVEDVNNLENKSICINDNEIKLLDNLIKDAKSGLNEDKKSEKDVWKGSLIKQIAENKITENKTLDNNDSINDQKDVNILPIVAEEINNNNINNNNNSNISNNNNNNNNNDSLKLAIIETINKFQYKKISKKNKLIVLSCVAVGIAFITLYLIKCYFSLDDNEVTYPTLSNRNI
jgi:hypothetical protein